MRKGERPGKAKTDKYKADFLRLYKATGLVIDSCKKMKINTETVRMWRREDKAFQEAFNSCQYDIDQLLENAAIKQGTKPAGVADRHFLLKANRPDKYTERRKHEFNGPAPIQVVYGNQKNNDTLLPNQGDPGEPAC